jgi:hypothetical protein
VDSELSVDIRDGLKTSIFGEALAATRRTMRIVKRDIEDI